MSLNLDTLRSEISDYLKRNEFIEFHGMSRRFDEMREIEWDTERYPDFEQFLTVAQRLGIRLIVFHHRDFSDSLIETAIDSLGDAQLDFEDQRDYEKRLREFRVYDGFTCALELSFEYNDSLYIFDLQTEWYRDLNSLLEEIDINSGTAEDDNEDPLGPYYSQN